MSGDTCKIEGCERPVHIKVHHLCNSHYIRMRVYGDPLAGKPEHGLTEKWIMGHLNTDSDECLIWPFSTNDHGYGRIRYRGREWVASRLMCTLKHGSPTSERYEAAHTCGKGHLGCTNPNHLRWATPEDNQADRVEHGTSNRGTRNAHAKLDENSVRLALEMRSSGIKQKEIAKTLNVSGMAISDLFNGQRWSWLTGIEPKKRGMGRLPIHSNDNTKLEAAS